VTKKTKRKGKNIIPEHKPECNQMCASPSTPNEGHSYMHKKIDPKETEIIEPRKLIPPNHKYIFKHI
jgi:hypothetical protein